MKIERTETAVRLVPENEWERTALAELRQKGVEKIEWQDDWNRTGWLQLNYPVHPWDRSGRR